MKTTVEWLVEHLTEYGFDLSHHELEIQQAKEMQERQLELFYLKGYQKRAENGIYDDISETHALMEFEKLKQLTFKSK